MHTGSLKLGKLSISPCDCIMTCRHTSSHTSGGNHLLVTDNEVICLPRICSYIDEKYGFRGFSQLMKINRRYVFLQMDKLLRNVAFCKPNLKMKFDFILLMKLLTNMNIERARYFFFNGFHKFDMCGLTYLKSLSIWKKKSITITMRIVLLITIVGHILEAVSKVIISKQKWSCYYTPV